MPNARSPKGKRRKRLNLRADAHDAAARFRDRLADELLALRPINPVRAVLFDALVDQMTVDEAASELILAGDAVTAPGVELVHVDDLVDRLHAFLMDPLHAVEDTRSDRAELRRIVVQSAGGGGDRAEGPAGQTLRIARDYAEAGDRLAAIPERKRNQS